MIDLSPREAEETPCTQHTYKKDPNQTEFGFVSPIVKEQTDSFELDYSDKDEDYRPAYAQHDCLKLQSSRPEDVEAWEQGEGKDEDNPRQIKMQWGVHDLALWQSAKTEDLKLYLDASTNNGNALPLYPTVKTWAENKDIKIGKSEANIKKYVQKIRNDADFCKKYTFWGGHGRGSILMIQLADKPEPKIAKNGNIKGGKTLKKECTEVHYNTVSTTNNTSREAGNTRFKFMPRKIPQKIAIMARTLPQNRAWSVDTVGIDQTAHIPANLAKALQMGYDKEHIRKAYIFAFEQMQALRKYKRVQSFTPAKFGKLLFEGLVEIGAKPDPAKHRQKPAEIEETRRPRRASSQLKDDYTPPTLSEWKKRVKDRFPSLSEADCLQIAHRIFSEDPEVFEEMDKYEESLELS